MSITPPDIVIGLILAFFSLNGLRHGFIDEIGKLISIISGFIIASKFHNVIIPNIKPYIDGNTLQVTIAYMLVFIATVTVVTIIFKILQKFIELILLGWLNRLLGFLLGLLKGFLIVSVFIFVIQALPIQIDKENTIKQKLENESVMYQICNHVKELVILTIPMNNHLDQFENQIKEISIEKNVQNILNK